MSRQDGQLAQQPIRAQATSATAAAAAAVATNVGPTLTVALQNQTFSNNVYAYITGRAIDKDGRWVIIQSDAVTQFYPDSPGAPLQPLPMDCAIVLGPPGNTVQAQIPRIAGGRIWFAIDRPLNFFLNPGPALVEPSVTNPSDPNNQINWGFAEFTWNADQLYANISFVDFVGPPIALTLNTRSGQTQHISGMNANGINEVANDLQAQRNADGHGWDQLIIYRNGTRDVLRVLSPNQGIVGNANLFAGYYDDYVNQVFDKYRNSEILVDTQASFGNLAGRVQSDALVVGGSRFGRPSTQDIWTCSTGPFQTGADAQVNALIPRLAAAFNRSTLLVTNQFPAPVNFYYQSNPTNHYSRIVHQHTLDRRGYGFPYDDVQANGATDQSGKVQAGDPTVFTVTVGGRNAYV